MVSDIILYDSLQYRSFYPEDNTRIFSALFIIAFAILIILGIILLINFIINPVEALLLTIIIFSGFGWILFWSIYGFIVLMANFIIKRQIRLTDTEMSIKVPLGRYNFYHEPFVFKYSEISKIYTNENSDLDFIVMTFRSHDKHYKLEKKDIPKLEEFLEILGNKVCIVTEENWKP